jgi:hypothetical protein
MLQNNSRIEQFNGYKFYERDILHDNYEFTYDVQITIDLTYITPGFGIALIDTGSCSIDDKPDTYLFKIGYREASIYFSNTKGIELIKQISCPEAKTVQDNLLLSLKKSGKKISLYLNDKLILDEYINKTLDKYNIGYYSNAGNIINTISLAANIPSNWVINMRNTQGGYIRFLDDSFEISDCRNNAEIEQSFIDLPPGTYYLKNKLDKVNNECDIKCYIYLSDDDRYSDADKNILDKNNSFTIYKQTLVNFKITGTNGQISDIILSTDKDADYIPTSLNAVNFDGSYIDIFIKELDKITWKGIISKTPYTSAIKEDIIYGLILDNLTTITPEKANVLLNKKYDYEFDVKTYIFYVKLDDEIVYSQRLLNISNKITIFKNLSAIITQLTLYKKNGEVIDIITQDEKIITINANITSPIIVVDRYNLPLDLSSSYRLCKYNDHEKYIFTNWEREYFESQRVLHLEKKIINNQDSIFVYGIRKNADFDLDDIYNVDEDKINSIDLLTKEYDFISELELLSIDKSKSLIYLRESDVNKYEYFIVDYLKDNSYCINYNYDKNIYEVNISSNEETKVLYDTKTISEENKTYTQTNAYNITNINGNINGYIVLTDGGE